MEIRFLRVRIGAPCDTDPHDFRPKGRPPWAPSCGKSPPNARLMASSLVETRATGAVVDAAVGGDRAAPHRAVGLHAPRSAATFRVLRDGMWAGQRVRRTQDAVEVMPRCMLHAALPAAPRGRTGIDFRRALQASSAHARQRGWWARVMHRQRVGAERFAHDFGA